MLVCNCSEVQASGGWIISELGWSHGFSFYLCWSSFLLVLSECSSHATNQNRQIYSVQMCD